MITAKIIADSKNEFGNRITTFVLTFPRIVLAEFNTHRAISKNSASSRAIPVEKMLKMVQENPFIPIKWMKNHKGMQGIEYFTDKEEIEQLKAYWLEARDNAVESVQSLIGLNLTKQVCNRLLEPFMYHTVICTGTEWENFFALRAHPDAEIHIQELAFQMLSAYNDSTPKQLNAGEWHIPFGDKFDESKILKTFSDEFKDIKTIFQGKELSFGSRNAYRNICIKIATARCARVSYLNFEGKDDYEADIKLHDILLASGHMSPFEHCAKAMNEEEFSSHYSGEIKPIICESEEEFEKWDKETIIHVSNPHSDNFGWNGNFRGFIQYRKTIPGENKIDQRVKK